MTETCIVKVSFNKSSIQNVKENSTLTNLQKPNFKCSSDILTSKYGHVKKIEM